MNGKIYLGGSTEPVYALERVPLEASEENIALTTAFSTGFQNYGATSLQEAALCPLPSLAAEPSTVPAGFPVDIVTQGWPPNAEVELTFTDAAGNVVATQTVTTDATGRIETTVTLPFDTAPGTLRIDAADGDGNTTYDTVTVTPPPYDPTLTATPEALSPGETVDVTSSDWPPNTELEVVYTDVDGNVVGTQTVTTDDDGNFTTDFVIPPGTPFGPLTVTASAPNGLDATDTVTVEADPVLEATPPIVAAGETVTAEGSGYAPNTPVEVVFTDAEGNVVGTETVTTDDDGAFTIDFEVPAGTEFGPLVIEGTTDAGLSASDTVTVEADPAVVASPGVVAPGETVTAEGTGYAPNSPVRTSPAAARSRDSARASSLISVAVTWATRRAKSSVIVPGPAPMSRRVASARRWRRRYAAEFSTVRVLCERSTEE